MSRFNSKQIRTQFRSKLHKEMIGCGKYWDLSVNVLPSFSRWLLDLLIFASRLATLWTENDGLRKNPMEKQIILPQKYELLNTILKYDMCGHSRAMNDDPILMAFTFFSCSVFSNCRLLVLFSMPTSHKRSKKRRIHFKTPLLAQRKSLVDTVISPL